MVVLVIKQQQQQQLSCFMQAAVPGRAQPVKVIDIVASDVSSRHFSATRPSGAQHKSRTFDDVTLAQAPPPPEQGAGHLCCAVAIGKA